MYLSNPLQIRGQIGLNQSVHYPSSCPPPVDAMHAGATTPAATMQACQPHAAVCAWYPCVPRMPRPPRTATSTSHPSRLMPMGAPPPREAVASTATPTGTNRSAVVGYAMPRPSAGDVRRSHRLPPCTAFCGISAPPCPRAWRPGDRRSVAHGAVFMWAFVTLPAHLVLSPQMRTARIYKLA